MKYKDSSVIAIIGVVLLFLGSFLYILLPQNKIYSIIILLFGLAAIVFYTYSHWKEINILFTYHAAARGVNFFLTVLIVLGILTFINAISARHPMQIDFTKSKKFSLSDQTQKILKNLNKEVNLTCFFKTVQPNRKEVEDLLKQYALYSYRFKYKFVDPDRKPEIAQKYKIQNYGTIVIESEGNEQRMSVIDEENLTNALLKILRNLKKSIYFVKGHGEKEITDTDKKGYVGIKEAIEQENYTVKDMNLMSEKQIPEDCAVLIIPGPDKDYFDRELKMLDQYIDNNGKIMVLIDPEVKTPELRNFLKKYGVKLSEDIVIDMVSGLFGNNPFVPVASEYPVHEITKNFKVATFYPLARSVEPADTIPPEVSINIMVQTIPKTWAETDLESLKIMPPIFQRGRDKEGPVPVAVSVNINQEVDKSINKKELKSKLIVFGDSDFISNASLNFAGNKDIFLNTIYWLVEEGELISIRPKEKEIQLMFITERLWKLFFWLPVVFLPLVVLSAGTFVIYNRRRKK